MYKRLAACVLAAGCDGTELPVVTGPHELYQVTSEHIPANSTEARENGFVGENGWTYNQLGAAFFILRNQGFGDPQASTDDALAMHTLELALDVQRNTQVAGVASYVGIAQDYDPTSPLHDPLVGTADGAVASVGPGDLDLAIAPFGTALRFTLHAAHVQLLTGPDDLKAVISGAVEPAFIDGPLMLSWKSVLDPIVARDCPTLTPPGCGCTPGSPGANALSFFDSTRDCVVDVDELVHNSLVQSVTQPDVRIDGQMMVSFGFVVDATFVWQVD